MHNAPFVYEYSKPGDKSVSVEDDKKTKQSTPTVWRPTSHPGSSMKVAKSWLLAPQQTHFLFPSWNTGAPCAVVCKEEETHAEARKQACGAVVGCAIVSDGGAKDLAKQSSEPFA